MVDKEKRVGAIMSIDEENKKVYLFGYGIFLGCFTPTEEVEGCSYSIRKNNEVNPKILLDSGKTVWGCECWWNDEHIIKMETENYQMKGFEIIDVDIDEIRKKQKEERESNMMDNFDEIYEDLKQSARMVFEHSLFPAGKPLEIYYQVIDDIEFLFHVFPSRKNMIIINRSEKSEEFDKMKESVIALNKILGIRFEW